MPEQFGRLMVADRHYTRRCRNCWHTARFPLPALNVTVLYLDQNVLSNVLRVLDPATTESRRARLQREGLLEFFQTAFEKIDRLCKLHLLVCPDSPVHYDESVVSPEFRKFKRLYELLSHGVSFWRPNQVRGAQLHNAAVEYVSGTSGDIIDLSRERIVNGTLNAWRDWFQISLNSGILPGLIEELKEAREKKSTAFSEVWQMWQQDSEKTFDLWYREERMALSSVLKRALDRMFRTQIEIRFGKRTPSIEDVLPCDNQRLVMALKRTLCGDDSDVEGFRRVWEFLESDALDSVSFVRISSLIFAALARRARNGQKCPRNPFNDVNAIAAYLPYCDAMFLDKEMQSLLMEEPVRGRLGYSTRIFSLRNKGDFLAYLDSIEANAPTGHMEKVREVYGTDWEKPFTQVFEQPT